MTNKYIYDILYIVNEMRKNKIKNIKKVVDKQNKLCYNIITIKEARKIKMVEKNAKKEIAKKQRVTNGFNTGTRDMKSEKYYDRKVAKKKLKKEIEEAD